MISELLNRYHPNSIFRLWEKQPQFTLCGETGDQAESGNCPVHGGDACLYQYVQVAALVRAMEEVTGIHS